MPGTPTSYNVTAKAAGTIPTTFMKVAGYQTLVVGATAIAGPAAQPATPNTTNGKTTSSASDWDTAYNYAVPLDAAGKPIWCRPPDKSKMVRVANNCNATDTSYDPANSMCNTYVAASATTLTKLSNVLPNQPIGMLLMNMKGGILSKNDKNAYGSKPGNIAILSSSALAFGYSPSYYADSASSAPIAQNILPNQTLPTPTNNTTYRSSVTNNCALQIQHVDPTVNYPAPPVSGSCFSLNDQTSGVQFANLICNQMAGRTFIYW